MKNESFPFLVCFLILFRYFPYFLQEFMPIEITFSIFLQMEEKGFRNRKYVIYNIFSISEKSEKTENFQL